MTCPKEGCTPASPCSECKEAIVDRCLDTAEGTIALFDAAHLPVPEVIADTKMHRMAQFYAAMWRAQAENFPRQTP